MDRARVDAVVIDDFVAVAESGSRWRPSRWSTSSAIRARLLRFGWVQDARVSRRLPDTLVIDIVERKPAAIWQNHGSWPDRRRRRGARPVPVDKMPDLPLLIGPDANAPGTAARQR